MEFGKFLTKISALVFGCWVSVGLAVANDVEEPLSSKVQPIELHVSCHEPSKLICIEIKKEVEARPGFKLIDYGDIGRSSFVASVFSGRDARSDFVSIHLMGNTSSFSTNSGVPVPEISKNMDYWARIVAATIVDSVGKKLRGEINVQ